VFGDAGFDCQGDACVVVFEVTQHVALVRRLSCG